MGLISSELQCRTWRKDSYLISTDHSLVPVATLNEIFGSSAFYWGKSMPESVMLETLQNSLCFGLYESLHRSGSGEQGRTTTSQPEELSEDCQPSEHPPQSRFVGFARCITDFTTFLYLTDVWVNPEDQGKGLGKWLISCIQETIQEMPYLRRSMLFTADWDRSVPFYEKLMDMTLMESQKGTGLALLERKGPGHPSYGRTGSGYN